MVKKLYILLFIAGFFTTNVFSLDQCLLGENLTTETIDESFDECPVCKDSFEEEGFLTSCGHLFCKPCIAGWLVRNHKECPLCRSSMVIDEETKTKLLSLVEEALVPEEDLFLDQQLLLLQARYRRGIVLQNIAGEQARVLQQKRDQETLRRLEIEFQRQDRAGLREKQRQQKIKDDERPRFSDKKGKTNKRKAKEGLNLRLELLTV